MGQLSHELFGVNGDTGITYHLAKRTESLTPEELDSIKDYAQYRGHVAVDGAMETVVRADATTAPGDQFADEGYIKLQPGFSPEEIDEIRHGGIDIEPLVLH